MHLAAESQARKANIPLRQRGGRGIKGKENKNQLLKQQNLWD